MDIHFEDNELNDIANKLIKNSKELTTSVQHQNSIRNMMTKAENYLSESQAVLNRIESKVGNKNEDFVELSTMVALVTSGLVNVGIKPIHKEITSNTDFRENAEFLDNAKSQMTKAINTMRMVNIIPYDQSIRDKILETVNKTQAIHQKVHSQTPKTVAKGGIFIIAIIIAILFTGGILLNALFGEKKFLGVDILLLGVLGFPLLFVLRVIFSAIWKDDPLK